MSPRKKEILSISAELMRHRGYENTTVRDIASRANMEAASLYNHIQSKDSILSDICFSLADELEKGILEVNDIYFNAQEKLGMAIDSHIEILTKQIDESYVFIHEWRHLSAERLSKFTERRDAYEKQFRSILRLGEQEGSFRDLDEKFAVITILSALNAVIEWYKPDGPLSAKQVAQKLTDFILTGLLKQS